MTEPSTSQRDGPNTAETLQQMFPQVQPDIINTVLDQEGTFEAAVEALLRSTGQEDTENQIEHDENLARALQAQMRLSSGPSNWFDFGRRGQYLPDQVAGESGETWEELKQAATETFRTISDGVSTFASTVSEWVAPPPEGLGEEPSRGDTAEVESLESKRRKRLQESKKDK